MRAESVPNVIPICTYSIYANDYSIDIIGVAATREKRAVIGTERKKTID